MRKILTALKAGAVRDPLCVALAKERGLPLPTLGARGLGRWALRP